MSYTSTVQYYTTHLTNMILEVTPSSWFRTVWTSMDPIHWRDPTKDASLSPTSTRAWRDNNPLKVARSTFLYCHHFSVHYICRTSVVPVGSPCEWAQICRHSLAAWTRNRWSEGSDKHSPSHCHRCDPACSGGNCRLLEPNTPWENTRIRVEEEKLRLVSVRRNKINQICDWL